MAKAKPTPPAKPAVKPAPPAKSIATVAPAVLTMAAANALSQAEIVASFKSKDQAASRLTVELAKLLIAFRTKLGAKASQATAILKKQGIRPGSVNTASETARVYAELVPAHVAETAFDQFTQADTRSINRCMSGASKRKLDGAAVADLLKTFPDTLGEELESIYATGETIAEADAQAKELLKQAEARKAQDKLDADSESARLDLEKKALEAGASAAGTPGAPDAPVPVVVAGATPDAPTADAGNATGEPAAPPPPGEPGVTNVIQLPPQQPADPDATLPETLTALDVILVAVQGFTQAGKEAIAMKLIEMNDALFPVVAAVAPKAGKQAKRA